ncbi:MULTISPECIES: hypothetical protein [Kitasatospora]|uniref:DUF4034 domain-containing protein n=2 Tax=Kitasatospora TaxID=2063 RepID=A0ABT1J0M1_9ACTN|nr:hypothetical protein [Kitasatospora paracochleata]MCP2310709.1 hypothetical protein [Kitasatospora paracochleata]
MAKWLGRGASQLDPHPARDDRPLRAVCEDATMGRWDGPRDLIASTGRDWDRRVFRLQILARNGVRLRWAEAWASAEPYNPDALAMLAHVQALRAIVAAEPDDAALDEAWRTCLAAAEAAPADPSPWLVMMALVRTLAPDWNTLLELWHEVARRDPFNRESHHEVLAYLMPRKHGSTTVMFDWVRDRVQGVPDGSPLVVLLLVAQAEHYRYRQSQRSGVGVAIHPWMECPDIDRVLERWWHLRPAVRHANFTDDANYLAHALSFAGRHREAHAVFEEIGPYAAKLPWAYCGDAEQLFQTHRERARNAPRSLRRR